MKRVILALCSLILIFLISCSNNANEITNIKIASDENSIIQNINDFRLDRIVLRLEYSKNKSRHIVVNEEDLSETFTKEIGLQHLKLLIENYQYEFDIFIYNEEIIRDNYIYYYYDDEKLNIFTATSILNSLPPIKNKYYFYGWFADEAKTIDYVDGQKKIVQLYPMWSETKTYKIDYYVLERLVKRKYVITGEMIEYFTPDIPDSYLFYDWDTYSLSTDHDLDIRAILYKSGQAVVRFFTKNNELLAYKVVTKGGSLNPPEAPHIEGYIFLGWTDSLTNIDNHLDIFPIYALNGTTYNVEFLDTAGNLLSSCEVEAGGTASFVNNDDRYKVVGYSSPLDNIYSDLQIIVYLTPYVYYYYIDNILYYSGLSIENPPKYPDTNEYLAVWQRAENNWTRFDLVYEKKGEYFNVHLPNSTETFMVKNSDNVTNNLSFYVAMILNKNVYYKWYLDENYTKKLGQSFNSNIVDVYGLAIEDDYSFIDITRVKLDYNIEKNGVYIEGFINYQNIWLTKKILNVAEKEMTVLGVSAEAFNNCQIIVIDEGIDYIYDLEKALGQTIGAFVVDEDNEYYYSLNGNLYSKKTDELLIEVGGINE